ncbi:SDR family NAD(P)-dependent oxidoreductase [Salsuginibacillus kocurii]|uniref:SDR family NAD(P)-dependent oxidoreductase n=1 Tax=Salsuginibacillus kocurii TaxID=427078 RepID=UPI0003797EB3|nr:SDR family NAD(P)-dependent oxidoreductase [Salsuginibacillus kocurii]
MEAVKLDSLKGRRILLTGGTKGIGRDVCEKLAEAGAHIGVVARSKDDLEKMVNDLSSINTNIIPIEGNVADLKSISNMVTKMKDHFGGIDVLINSAGVNKPKPALEIEEEDWDQVIDINLKGAFFLAQRAGKVMKDQQFGKIINLSSQMGHVGYYGRAAYCASKGGLELLTKTLAVELAPYVRVNTVAPTFIETPLTEGYFADEEFKKQITANIPLGYIGQPEDVTGAILYLASDLSNLVTGTSLKVDGGWTAW